MQRRIARALTLAFAAATAAGLTLVPAASAGSVDWPQWGQNPQHQGFVDVAGRSLDGQLADIVYDPFVPQEQADAGGDLLAHYQAPLAIGNDVFMEFKTGRWVSCDALGNPIPPDTACGSDAWNNQIWNEKRLHWEGNPSHLVEQWSFQSDWKPEPDAGGLGGWEPVFHAVVAGDFVYVPGAAGTVYKLDRDTGAVVSRINPFGSSLDASIFVAGVLSADATGNVYYNAIKLNTANPWFTNVQGSWLVKVSALNDSASTVTYQTLVPGAPDMCSRAFGASTLPWPPSPTAQPSIGACGSQRPGINVAPAIAPDGTVYTVSRAHFNSRYSYVVAANADLTPKWAASMRDLIHDGCGVLDPIGTSLTPPTPNACRKGTPANGVDPQTNQAPAGRVIDQSSSSPTVAPDGSVLYGAYTRYNAARGHLFKFSAGGVFQAAYDFGWDTTPATRSHDGTYSIVEKDNHYDVGRYCNPFQNAAICAPLPAGPYYITQLNANLVPEWKFQNTNTQSCSRNADGTLTCVSNHPNGFEWCINAPAIDQNGVVYANSEDGNLYSINSDGTEKQRFFLNLAIGAAYTPLALDRFGRIYTENDGHLFVVGTGGRGVGHAGGHAATVRTGDRHTNLDPTD